MEPENIEYRGYSLLVVQDPPVWQVHIYPTMPDKRIPRPGNDAACKPTKNEAVVEAMDMVDNLLTVSAALRDD